jgi:hypothetical protein
MKAQENKSYCAKQQQQQQKKTKKNISSKL